MRSGLMMAIVLCVPACGKAPAVAPPPNTAAFGKSSADQKCDAAAPRAMKCSDELIVAQLRQLDGGGELADSVKGKFAEDRKQSSDAELRKIHQSMCLGEKDGAFAERVVTCWATAECEAFARCVFPVNATK